MSETPATVPSADTPLIRAAIYARMSTEHQQYSTENQCDTIREYAAHHNMEVVRTYADEGKSGLRLDGRNSLKQLIGDVQGGKADFEVILVYDVSRWGRFQDADESAYYEFICRQAGITVHYCAEQFENDGSPVSTIVKGVKRAMAGEYSRELSNKVFKGQCRLIHLGFRQGGMAGYGLRRMLIDQSGESKGILAFGEKKSIQTDRVILVPGPDEEVENIRWIYQQFVTDRRNENEIAKLLNEQGVKTDLGREWNRGTVHEVLTNEKYIGNNIFNRVSFKLKKKRVVNPSDMWIRSEGVFAPLINPKDFYIAQGIILERSRRLSDEDLLAKLREIQQRRGMLSALIIDEYEDAPSSSAYRYRFGSLVRAYQMIGYDSGRDYQYLEINRLLRQMYPDMVRSVLNKIGDLGGSVEYDEDTGLIRVNGEFTASLVLVRSEKTGTGSCRWNIRLDASRGADLTIAVRMDESNKQTYDFYLLPAIDMAQERLRLAEENATYFDAYRFQSLDYLYEMARRSHIEEAA